MRKIILIFILILAGILRLVGIYPGYHPNHSDEVNIYSSTVTMLKEGNFEPMRYEYGPLPSYINLFFFKTTFIPLSWGRFYIENLGQVIDGTIPLRPTALAYKSMLQLKILGERDINTMYWSRTITAIFGIGVVFLVYKISTNLFDKKAGLISAFLIAINYRQVLNSHFVLPDIYNSFFLLVAFLLSLRIYKKPSFKNYFLIGITCGLSFSIKYQFFSFLPLIVIQLYKALEEKELKEKIKTIFNPAIIAVPFIALCVFLILNPYLFVHLDTAREQLLYVGLKYRLGKNFLDFYPISYLYHYGIGKLTSISILVGVVLMLFKNLKKEILLLSVIIPFFYITTYATGGGFYTRNFVSITPFLIIFAGFFLSKVISTKYKYPSYLILLIFILLTGFENINKSMVLVSNYIKPWNEDVVKNLIQEKIPSTAKIAAHSSVPIPDSFPKRLDYDFYPAFSVDEFLEEGAQWAIANYEWETNDFYWWMTQDTTHSLEYWKKPEHILKEMYPGMALRELEDFGMYSVTKPAFAPDANFLIVKLPEYQVSNKKLSKQFSFNDGSEGWNKIGKNMSWRDGQLIIEKGAQDLFTRWESPEIKLKEKGFELNYKIKTEDTANKREGFVFVKFYRGEEEIGIRVSKRNNIYNKWVESTLIGQIPDGTEYMKIGFQVYNAALANIALDDLRIYEGQVVNKSNSEIKHIEIEKDILYPISHGNM